jgi:hypothetical protein
MVLSEQIYTNTNRKYYHGANENKTVYDKYIKPTSFFGSHNEIPMVWLTTNVLYAMDYIGINNDVFNPKGRIYICKLVDPTNIFNIMQNTDRSKLLKYCKNKTSISEDNLLDLFSKDWTDLVSIKREELQKIIYNMGYEGLFNYENGYNNKYAPSIGLFNSEKAEIIETVFSKDFETKFEKQINNGDKRAKAILLSNGYIDKDLAKKAHITENILIKNSDIWFEDDKLDIE